MCPESDDIESRASSSSSENGDHQQQHLRNIYNPENDGDEFIHRFIRKIQVTHLLRWLPLNQREPLSQASLPFPFQMVSEYSSFFFFFFFFFFIILFPLGGLLLMREILSLFIGTSLNNAT
ncbi:hypothetical protein ES332_D09G248600v1 [Gossypium tomentosum]|uniref:Uncharacterized protein n=1 Tax=Gossypium tomentosum TaxID=34277 RepID=A0A5D2JMK6_GOSTO|nr:hypothetical protein ES332_D09G248600v1 [Gossypium tomentosum]